MTNKRLGEAHRSTAGRSLTIIAVIVIIITPGLPRYQDAFVRAEDVPLAVANSCSSYQQDNNRLGRVCYQCLGTQQLLCQSIAFN